MEAPVRLADVLGGLSVVSDMGYGLPSETAMRACLAGTGLAREMDLSEEEVGHVFHVSLLLHVGCIAFSHETAVLFGDDLAVNRAAIRTEVVKPDWRITNWFNGILLGVADRDDDLLAGMRTTLAGIKATAEAQADTAASAPGTAHVTDGSER